MAPSRHGGTENTMKQSKIESFIEATLNVGSGFVLSLIFWRWVIVPLFHLDTSWGDNLTITGLFTVLSITRSYIWRRLFNAGVHKTVHQWVTAALAPNHYTTRTRCNGCSTFSDADLDHCPHCWEIKE